MSPAMSPRVAGRGPLSLALDRRFGVFFLGRLLSSGGVWIFSMVAVVLAYDLTGDTVVVALVTTALFAPQVLLAPLSGRLSDRGNPARQLVGGRLLAALGMTVLVFWLPFADERVGVAGAIPVLACSIIVGIGFALGAPALQAIVPSLLRPEELASGIALSGFAANASRAIAPAIGGVLLVTVGPVATIAVGAATQYIHAAILAGLHLGRIDLGPPATDRRVSVAARFVLRDRGLLGLLVAMAAVGAAAEPAITLAPAIAVATGGRSEDVGLLASSFGVGAAVAFVGFGWLQRRVSLRAMGVGGLALMAAGLVVTAAAPTTLGAAMGLGISGAGMTAASTSVTTEVQNRTPAELRGRVMAFWMVAYVGSRPLVALGDGWLTDHVSVDAALLATAVVTVAAIPCVRMRSRLALPTPDVLP